MVIKKIGDFSEYLEVTGTPRESYWAIVEERRQAMGGGVRPTLAPIRIAQGEGVCPPFPSPSLPFPFPSPLIRKRGGQILLGLGVQV